MPIYEYACAKCGETIEAIQNFSDTPLKKHQGCGGKLSKLLSLPSFVVKTPDGFGDSNDKHPSILQETENRRISNEKKKKSAPIRSISASSPGPKASPAKAKRK